ncbi:MAG: Rieske (2Fe-2S) protein [Pseudomonadota bacterium]
MAAHPRLICASADLAEGGPGVRFDIEHSGEAVPAFAVRFRGRVHAYVNRCQHVGIELDWLPGQFFDDSRLYLICATHGATYRPDTGECAGGPCRGGKLTRLPVSEREGAVFLEWKADD